MSQDANKTYALAVFILTGLLSSFVFAATPLSAPITSSASLPAATEDLPALLTDDLDKVSLVRVVENQLAVMKGKEGSRPARLGSQVLTHIRLQETLETFLSLLNKNLPPEEFDRQLREQFVFYPASDGSQAFFTGYYTPVLKASRTQTEKYIYPLYQLPENLYKPVIAEHDPSDIDSNYSPIDQLITREDIDGRNALANRNLEIVWLESDIERFFLHIQGSGVLKYEDGTTEGIQYVGSNGYPYSGIGKLMAQDGAIDEVSMQGIKNYLLTHPDTIPKYFYQNPRYVFFRLTNDPPRGSGGAELVALRSIATDKSLYSAGGLAFIAGEKPILNDKNEVTGWAGFSRFVVDQDTGNSIKGPGRVDLYFGQGDRAGEAAGRYVAYNKMFYLLKRE